MAPIWHQVELSLVARPRGIHLITAEVLAALPRLGATRVGMLNLFLQHTSASLAINENADPEVRADLERWLNRAVPDGAPYFEHTDEGDDDMPAHVKATLLGPSLSIPVRAGRLALGIWQGIYLAEHRHRGGVRRLVATLWGEGE
jgi:secondary thiamine-phosphate synthase enzyme